MALMTGGILSSFLFKNSNIRPTFTDQDIRLLTESFKIEENLHIDLLNQLNINIDHWIFWKRTSLSKPIKNLVITDLNQIRKFIKDNIKLVSRLKENFKSNHFDFISRLHLENFFSPLHKDKLFFKNGLQEIQEYIDTLESTLKEISSVICGKHSAKKQDGQLVNLINFLIDIYQNFSKKEAIAYPTDATKSPEDKSEYKGEFYKFCKIIIDKINENGGGINCEIGSIICTELKKRRRNFKN